MITGFAADVQKLVDGINYMTESPICVGVPSNDFVDVGFYLYTTAICKYASGIGIIFDVVSGPIAENQVDKYLT